MRFDSNYSILRDILINKLGGDANKHYDSCYSILLDILDNIGGGGKSIVVDLPATISEDGVIDIQATVSEDGVINL